MSNDPCCLMQGCNQKRGLRLLIVRENGSEVYYCPEHKPVKPDTYFAEGPFRLSEMPPASWIKSWIKRKEED